MDYEKVYSRFFVKFADKEFFDMFEDTPYILLNEWLDDALAMPFIRKIFSSLNINDETQTITYVLATSIDEISDEKFVINILAQGIKLGWFNYKADRDDNLAPILGGKEEKLLRDSYDKMIDRIHSLEIKLKKDIRDYGYINGSYDLNEES